MVVSRKLQCVAALAIVGLMLGVNFVGAQDDAEPKVPNAKPADSVQHFRAKQVLGAKVQITGDTAVGTVDDIVLDEHGNVDYLIVAKADNTLVTVPWDAAIFNAENRVATVQITQENFQQIPTYTVKQYPVFSKPAYQTQVYKYYGLTPGQERRILRRGGVVEVK